MPSDGSDYGFSDSLMQGLLSGPTTDTEVGGELLGALGANTSGTQSGRRTHIDPFAQLQAQRQLNPRPEFAPFASGIRFLYTGGNPFPQREEERDASDLIAETALASNLTDALANSAPLRRRRQQQQLEALRQMSPEQREQAMMLAILSGALDGGEGEGGGGLP